ncbi:PAS domain-containing protein, partial [Puniceibacterium confluentis]
MLSNMDERLIFLTAGDKVASLIETRAWHGHPLGAPQDWSQSLKTALQVILASPSPTFVCWGPEQFLFYNDAFASLLGAAHPEALAEPAGKSLQGMWPDLAPAMAQVVNRGEAAQLTTAIPSSSGRQAIQHVLTLSPLADDQGRPRAVLCTILETQAERFNADEPGDL